MASSGVVAMRANAGRCALYNRSCSAYWHGRAAFVHVVWRSDRQHRVHTGFRCCHGARAVFGNAAIDRDGDDDKACGILAAVSPRSRSAFVSGRRHLLLHRQGRSRSLYARRDPVRFQQSRAQLLGHHRAARPGLVSAGRWRLVACRVPFCARELHRGRDAQWLGDIPLQGRSGIEFALSDRAANGTVLHQG